MVQAVMPAPIPRSAPSPDRHRPRRPHRPRDLTVLIGATSILALLAVLLLIPVGNMLSAAVSSTGWRVITELATTNTGRTVVWHTVLLGITVALLGSAVAFLLAYVQARVHVRGKRVLHVLALVPIVSPPFAFATALIVLFSANGLISTGVFGTDFGIYGLKGLTIGLVLAFFPAPYINMLGMLRSLDPSLEEAASNLGATRWTVFRKITAPMMIPGLAASFLLLFVEAVADLANPLVLGGNYDVLAARAYHAISDNYDVPGGAAYATTLLVPGFAVYMVQRYWVSRRNVVAVTGKPSGRTHIVRDRASRIALLTPAVAIAAFIVLIYATIIVGGFVKILGVNNGFTFGNFYYVLFGGGLKAVQTTTLLAVIAMPISGFLGVAIAWLAVRKLGRFGAGLDFLGMLGLVVPGPVLGIGYAMTFNTPFIAGTRQFFPALAGGGAILGGAAALVMVYASRSLPGTLRAGVGALHQITPAIEEAAISLGATTAQTLRKVSLPLIRPALLSGLTYAFARSMTTLSPIIFLTTPSTLIITNEINGEVAAGRFGNAFAYCTVLIAIVLCGIAALNLVLRSRAQPHPIAHRGIRRRPRPPASIHATRGIT